MRKDTVVKLVEFLQRLGYEGNTHLLDGQECLAVLQSLQDRVDDLRRDRVLGQ